MLSEINAQNRRKKKKKKDGGLGALELTWSESPVWLHIRVCVPRRARAVLISLW